MAEAGKETPSSPEATSASVSESCRKKKADGATFMQDVLDHIDEFVHASMEDHKNCFHKSMSKMFGLTKSVSQPASSVESVIPLRVTTSDS